jgi:hypothetical protein
MIDFINPNNVMKFLAHSYASKVILYSPDCLVSFRGLLQEMKNEKYLTVPDGSLPSGCIQPAEHGSGKKKFRGSVFHLVDLKDHEISKLRMLFMDEIDSNRL